MPRDIQRRWLYLPPLLLLLSPLLLFWPYLRWRARPQSPFRVGVVDKTVPHPDRREHASLTWVLNHARAPAPSGSSWDPAADYLGYRPETKEGERISAEWLKTRSLVYLADTYGVYSGDVDGSGHAALDYSEMIYGGLDAAEAKLLEEYVRSGGALIGEFNSLASPTAGEARARLEALFGLKWTGWAGRWFADLGDETEVPGWARRFYKVNSGHDWDLRGPGFLLVHEDTRIIPLREGVEIDKNGLVLSPGHPRDPMLARTIPKLPFRYWFDIVAPRGQTETLASYRLLVEPAGADALAKANIPTTFPAILRASKAPLVLYFAGDFADNELTRGPYSFAGWPTLMRWLSVDENDAGAGTFFWGFYVPAMRELLAGQQQPAANARR